MILRILTEADRDPLVSLLTDRRVARTYMLPDFSSAAEAVPLARRLMQLSREADRFVRGMEEEGVLVGFLNDVEIQGGTIELGYAVHPDHWNRGCATAALKLAIAELFQRGYREILCGAFEENTASIRVMEKAGMERTDKDDEIEYRGKAHRCLYCSIQK